jgi:hypothetical protein
MDIASRYAWAIPLQNKESKTVLKAFLEIFDHADAQPKKLWVDGRSE